MGCYESNIVLFPEDYDAPAGIRKALTRPPVFRSARAEMPDEATTARGEFGQAVSWAFPIQQELCFPGCIQVLHRPTFFLHHGYKDLMLIWKPAPGKLAVGIAARTDWSAWKEL